MGKISVHKIDRNEFLYPEAIEKALSEIEFREDISIAIEPNTGRFQYCQDYSYNPESNPEYVFYTLPSWRKDHVEKMGANCALVSYAVDEMRYKPDGAEKKYDIGFVGTRYYPERRRYLDTITGFYPRSFASFYDLPRHKTPQILNESKILFNHTRPDIDVNYRFFETMAMGCQLMLRNEWLDEFAKEDVHYIGYSTPEECIAKIQMLLADDELRQKITYNARSHFLSSHTVNHRAQAIVNHLTEYYENRRHG